MEITMEDIVSQQISAAIDALSHARAGIASADVDLHLGVAASFIQDIQFNVLSLRGTNDC
jgi:hypothetical protein